MNIEDEKKRDAEKCLQKAESSYSTGDFDKAERWLLKAERIYPTTLAKRMLNDVLAAKGQTNEGESSNNSECSTDSNSTNSSRSDYDADAEKCIKIARNAIENGDLVKARRFLKKSEKFSTNKTTRELLKQLEEIEESISKTYYSGAGQGSLDDAEKCIEKAQIKFASSELKRAEELLLKAERLYPTARAKDLLRQVRSAIVDGLGKEETRKEKIQVPKSKPDEYQRPKPLEPTAEQIKLIKRVHENKDDYEILGLKKGASLEAVDKARKKLVQLLHPDKNKAPRAKEAFMIVLEAAGRIKKQLKNKIN